MNCWQIKYLSKKIILLFFILFFCLFAFLIWQKNNLLFTTIGDISFHLATANGFNRAGGPVTWNYWEALPQGRANNYPPIFHIILATLLKTSLTMSAVVQIITFISIVIGLAIFITGVNKLFGWKVAIFGIIPIMFSMRFLNLSSMVQPATIATCLSPWLLIFIKQKKWVNLWAILVFLFYLHMVIPFALVVGILFMAKNYYFKNIKQILICILAALSFYFPWLVHIIKNASYIKYINNLTQNSDIALKIWSFDCVVIIVLVVGFVLLRAKKININSDYYYFIFLSIIFLPVSYFFPSRALNGHSFLMIAPIFGLIIANLAQYKLSSFVVLILVFCLEGNLYFKLSNTGSLGFSFEPSSIRVLGKNLQANNVYTSTSERQIEEGIIKNSNEKEGIAVLVHNFRNYPADKNDQIHIANYFSAPANRPVLNMRQPELSQRSDPDFNNARILLTSIKFDNFNDFGLMYPRFNQDSEIYKFKNTFTLIDRVQFSATSNLFIYKNTASQVEKEKPAKPIIPMRYAQILVLLLIILILTPVDKILKKK